MGLLADLFGNKSSLKQEDLNVHTKRFSALLPYKSADFKYEPFEEPATDLYYLKDNSVLKVYECTPMVLADEQSFNSLANIIEKSFPEGTIIQVALLADDYVDKIVSDYQRLRAEAGGMFQEQSKRLSEHFKRALNGMEQLAGTPVRNFRLFISIKIPVKAKPYDQHWQREMNENLNLLRDAESSISSMGLAPKVMAPAAFITLLTSLINPDMPRQDLSWDLAQTIDRQIVFADTSINVGHDHMKFGSMYACCLTPKKYPRQVDFFSANSLIGLMNGGKSNEDDSKQIRAKFLYSVNIIKTNLKGLIQRKGKQAAMQETPKDGATAPGVVARKREYGWAFNAMEQGEEFCRIIPIMWVFDKDYEKLSMIVSDLKSIWHKGANIESQQEQDYLLPKLFVSSLPGGLYGKDIMQLQRDWIVTTNGAARFASINGGYTGNGKPYLLFLDRRGQLSQFDFFNTAANRNILITGGSGGGKSFLMNVITSSYYSCGVRIRIMDVGGSYEKLSYLVDGTYIYPLKDRIVINFFETLKLPDFEGEGLDEDEAIFISSSMPSATIKNYIRVADGRTLFVLRGTVGPDPAKIMPTLDYIRSLVCPDGNLQNCTGANANIVIDPILFREYAITRVPAIVIKDNDTAYRFVGAMPVKYVLEKIGGVK